MSAFNNQFQSEPNWMDWLAVEQMSQLIMVNLDTQDDDEVERWADTVAKYAELDDAFEYVDVDGIERLGINDIEPEETDQHDWVSPVQEYPEQAMLSLACDCVGSCKNLGYSEACTTGRVEWSEPTKQYRYEYKQDWNSIADRPNEDFFLGLAGLRFIAEPRDSYYKSHVLCTECNLYTTKTDAECGECGKLLVLK